MSTISTIAQWLVALAGVVALVFSLRLNTLKDADSQEIQLETNRSLNAANKKTEDAQKAAQIARANANAAREETERLKRELEPRRITEELQNKLITALNGLSPQRQKTRIVVASRMMDHESEGYGKALARAIEKSGLQVEFSPMSTHTFQGISVFHPSVDTDVTCDILRQALRKTGIPFSSERLDIRKVGVQDFSAVYLIVGHK